MAEKKQRYINMKGSSGSQLASSMLWGSCLFKAVTVYRNVSSTKHAG